MLETKILAQKCQTKLPNFLPKNYNFKEFFKVPDLRVRKNIFFLKSRHRQHHTNYSKNFTFNVSNILNLVLGLPMSRQRI